MNREAKEFQARHGYPMSLEKQLTAEAKLSEIDVRTNQGDRYYPDIFDKWTAVTIPHPEPPGTITIPKAGFGIRVWSGILKYWWRFPPDYKYEEITVPLAEVIFHID